MAGADADPKELLRRLTRVAGECRERGDRLGEAAAMYDMAFVSLSENPHLSLAWLEQAVALAREADDAQAIGRYQFARGMLLRQLGAKGKAESDIRAAIELARDGGDEDAERKRLAQLVRNLVDDGDGRGALEASMPLVRLLEAAGPSIDLVRIRLDRAAILQVGLWGRAAAAECEAALEGARALDDEGLQLLCRLERWVSWNLQVDAEPTEPLERIHEDVVQFGDAALLARVQMQRLTLAHRDGQWDETETLARELIAHALEVSDYQTYLLANTTLAEVHLARDDVAGAIDVLSVCRNSLDEAVGRPVAMQVQRILAALRGRIGEDAWAVAVAEARDRQALRQ